jgi:hypothetical protein
MASVRELACGPDCIWPDREHLEPHVDWIGDSPLAHGEDEDRNDEDDMPFCLCGHPNYLTCPRWASEGLMSMEIS